MRIRASSRFATLSHCARSNFVSSEIFSKFSLLSPLKNSGFSRAKKLLNFARYSLKSRRVKSSSLIINALFDLVGFALKLRACAFFGDESAQRKGVGEIFSRHDLRRALFFVCGEILRSFRILCGALHGILLGCVKILRRALGIGDLRVASLR